MTRLKDGEGAQQGGEVFLWFQSADTEDHRWSTISEPRMGRRLLRQPVEFGRDDRIGSGSYPLRRPAQDAGQIVRHSAGDGDHPCVARIVAAQEGVLLAPFLRPGAFQLTGDIGIGGDEDAGIDTGQPFGAQGQYVDTYPLGKHRTGSLPPQVGDQPRNAKQGVGGTGVDDTHLGTHLLQIGALHVGQQQVDAEPPADELVDQVDAHLAHATVRQSGEEYGQIDWFIHGSFHAPFWP